MPHSGFHLPAGGARGARNGAAAWSVATAGALAIAVACPAAASAKELTGAFHADAFATSDNLTVGPIGAQLAKSSNVVCPCEGTNGQTVSSEVDKVSTDLGVLVADVTKSTAYGLKTATTAETKETSTLTGLKLLSGLITADAITAVADLEVTKTTMTASTSGSTLANLKVAGIPIDPNVAPNTVLDIPSVGTVTLFKVTDSGDFSSTGQVTVNMITIDVSVGNSLGLPVGAEVVIGHASAGYARKQPKDVFSGTAYLALANSTVLGTVLDKVGDVNSVTLPCGGTSGGTLTNSVTADSVSGILSIGAGTSTGMTKTSKGVATGTTTATVSSLSLLGMIGASTITSVAQETLTGTTLTYSTNGSTFAGLTVLGLPIPLSIPPNTGISLPLLGSVVVNEQTLPSGVGDPVVVNGLHVTVGMLNLLGLPIGSELRVAHADVTVMPF